ETRANQPPPASARLATRVDARARIDPTGPESLLGRGDMLYLPSGNSRVQRVHAPFVTEKEIAVVVESWRAQGLAQYEDKFLEPPRDEAGKAEGGGSGEPGDEAEHDELYHDAVRLVIEFGKASTSLL